MYHPRKCVALLLLSAMGLTSATGCLSVGIEKVGKPATGLETGSLQVSVYQHRSRDGKGDPPDHPVVSELSRVAGPDILLVRETSEARWSADGLTPGKYRLRVARFIDDRGETRLLPSAVQETFSVRPGETVSAEVIVKRFPTGAVVAAGAAVAGGVLIAAFLSAWNHSGGVLKFSGKRKHRKELHTQALPAPRLAPIPSPVR